MIISEERSWLWPLYYLVLLSAKARGGVFEYILDGRALFGDPCQSLVHSISCEQTHIFLTPPSMFCSKLKHFKVKAFLRLHYRLLQLIIYYIYFK